MCTPSENARKAHEMVVKHADTLLQGLSPSVSLHGLHGTPGPYAHTDIRNTPYRFSGAGVTRRKGTRAGGACGQGSTLTKGVSKAKVKHVCKECGKVFKRAHNLKIHGRLHTGARPYKCPFANCQKDFRWKSSIVSHVNWHRSKLGEELPRGVSVHRLMKREGEGGGVESVESVEADDVTVVTAASYHPAVVGVGELDCLNVLDVKEWDGRDGRLVPSLSCCRLESEGESFGAFLEEH